MPTPVVLSLDDSDKVRIRSHMGYPQVRATASFALGTPAAIETSFIIELAMNEVLPEAVPLIRDLLNVLDGLELIMVQDHDLAAVNTVGEITLNQKEQSQLDSRYERWLAKLENIMGVARNPFDKIPQRKGINARVSH